jgi:hypothetical protein
MGQEQLGAEHPIDIHLAEVRNRLQWLAIDHPRPQFLYHSYDVTASLGARSCNHVVILPEQ